MQPDLTRVFNRTVVISELKNSTLLFPSFFVSFAFFRGNLSPGDREELEAFVTANSLPVILKSKARRSPVEHLSAVGRGNRGPGRETRKCLATKKRKGRKKEKSRKPTGLPTCSADAGWETRGTARKVNVASQARNFVFSDADLPRSKSRCQIISGVPFSSAGLLVPEPPPFP
jgi:hypothetical protein